MCAPSFNSMLKHKAWFKKKEKRKQKTDKMTFSILFTFSHRKSELKNLELGVYEVHLKAGVCLAAVSCCVVPPVVW